VRHLRRGAERHRPRQEARRQGEALRAPAQQGLARRQILAFTRQAADDLQDLTASASELGKPAGRDAALGRPNLGRSLGVDGARVRLEQLVDQAIAAIPDSGARPLVRGWVERVALRLSASAEAPMLKEARR